ncbi:MAG: ATP-binding protein [Saprospiraceae bacterium]
MLILILTIACPSVLIGLFLAPLLLQAIYSENHPKWRIALLVLIGSCFYANLLLSTEGTPTWFVSPYDYMSIVEINCVISGLTCSFIAGINRDLNLEVNQAAKRHALELEEQVTTIETARNELKTISGNLLVSKRHLDDQIAIEEQNQVRLNEAHEQLEQFSLAASHDLKEPIRTIRLYTQLVQKRLPEDLKGDRILQEHFQFITNSCKHMYAALEKLLVYQRASYSEDETVQLSVNELWQQQLLRAAINFRTIFKEEKTPRVNRIALIEQFIQTLGVSAPSLNSNSDHTSDAFLMGRNNAETLFYEIALNALMFRNWDKEIQIKMETSHPSLTRLQVSISDNGIGIEKAYLEQVFGMFKRIHPRETFPGTGLGLPIIRRIVTLAEGTIKLKSDKTKGTTLIIKVPRPTSAS